PRGRGGRGRVEPLRVVPRPGLRDRHRPAGGERAGTPRDPGLPRRQLGRHRPLLRRLRRAQLGKPQRPPLGLGRAPRRPPRAAPAGGGSPPPPPMSQCDPTAEGSCQGAGPPAPPGAPPIGSSTFDGPGNVTPQTQKKHHKKHKKHHKKGKGKKKGKKQKGKGN